MATPELILSMEGVTKVYGSGEREITALADVDLEARASRMEEHVSSQEYELNKEFKDMRGP